MFRFAYSLLSGFSLTACSTQQISMPAKVNLKLVSENVTGLIAETVLLERPARHGHDRIIYESARARIDRVAVQHHNSSFTGKAKNSKSRSKMLRELHSS